MQATFSRWNLVTHLRACKRVVVEGKNGCAAADAVQWVRCPGIGEVARGVQRRREAGKGPRKMCVLLGHISMCRRALLSCDSDTSGLHKVLKH